MLQPLSSIEETVTELSDDAIGLLKKLIATPSFSKEEDKTADILMEFFTENHIGAHRKLNNVWATNKYYKRDQPTLLLNSHHDTVKPNSSYTIDPFEPKIIDGKLY